MISLVLSTVSDSGLSWLNSSVCFDITRVLVHFAWQGTAIAIAFMFLNAVMVRASANARYLVGVVALAVLATCPLVTYCLLPDSSAVLRVDVAPAAWIEKIGDGIEGDSSMGIQIPGSFFVSEPNSGDNPAIAPRQVIPSVWLKTVSPFVAATYIAGIIAMLIRLAIAFRAGYRLRSISTQINDGPICHLVHKLCARWVIRAVPVVAYCQRVTVPVIVGVIRPMILLPPSLMSGLTFQQLEALLAHEIAHIRRWDLVVNLAQRIVESFLFLHPAVWYISHRISVERENACDDLVLASGWHSTDYVSALLSLADLCAGSRNKTLVSASILAATGDSPSQLKQRVLRMLGEMPASSTRHSVLIPVLFLVGTLSIVMTLSTRKEMLTAIDTQTQQMTSSPASAELTTSATLATRQVNFTKERKQKYDQHAPTLSTQPTTLIPLTPTSLSHYKLLYFRHEHSIPCQRIDPIIKKIDAFPVEMIDIEKDWENARNYHVDSVPCIVTLYDGKEVSRQSGFVNPTELADLEKGVNDLTEFCSNSSLGSASSAENALMVMTYSVADLLCPIPSGLPDDNRRMSCPPKIPMATWLSLIDDMTNSIEPKSWKMNGGECSIQTFDATLSLVIRAPQRIHEQVADRLAQIRRKMDVQVCTEICWVRDADRKFLSKSGFSFKFDSNTKCVHLTPEETKKFKHQMQARFVFAPKLTTFDNQVAHIVDHGEGEPFAESDLCLFFRSKVMSDPKRIRINFVFNPRNLVSELIDNVEFIEDERYVLFDVNELLKKKNPALNLPHQTYVLICPRIIVMEEELMGDDSVSATAKD